MPARRQDPQDVPPDVQRLANAAVNGFFNLPPAVQLAAAVVLLVAGLIAAGLWYAGQQGQQQQLPTGVATGSSQLYLGNPSGATDDGRQPDNFLMVKPFFALSYNNPKGTPNWVSWRLTAADLGTAPRAGDFVADVTLPSAFDRIYSRDYDGSGFDRGHLCPHGDRMASEQMSYATFVMTNVIPQAPNVNQKAWAQEEAYCRDLARHGHRLYIVAGPAGIGGVGRRGPQQTLARGRVTVPSDCWKVAVVLDDDPGVDPDPRTLGPSTRVIAVDMPNDHEAVGEAWAGFRTTPADVERRTGLHFFDALRPDVAAALRQRVDAMPVPPPRDLRHEGD